MDCRKQWGAADHLMSMAAAMTSSRRPVSGLKISCQEQSKTLENAMHAIIISVKSVKKGYEVVVPARVHSGVMQASV
jgi:hypothetical protein